MKEDRTRATELIVSAVLRSGVLISAAVILMGLVLFVVHGAGGGEGGIAATLAFPRSIAQVWAGLRSLDPISVITLGLLLVILTPVSRVAVSIFAFAMERDWRYVAITALVLTVLVASFLVGEVGG